jgi:ATP-dependent protease ClpP protease subunit
MIAGLAINATTHYLARRLAQSPEDQNEFWVRQMRRYAPMHSMSEMEQAIHWRYPNRTAVVPKAQAEPLSHLPTVNVGFNGCGDGEGIWRFAIRGEMCFRESPASLLERAKNATEFHLEIDSGGGDGRWALEFGARLRDTGKTIIATARRAFSAGCLLLQAAHVRRIVADGCLMIHGPQQAVFGSAEDFEREAVNLRAARGQDLELYTMRTGQPRNVVDRWLSSDNYFRPAEAVASGLADEIIPAEIEK